MLAAWKNRVQRVIALVLSLLERYPHVVALFGFCSGLFSFMMVDRHRAGFARAMAIVMLVSWLWLMLENLLTERVRKRFGWSVPPGLLRYATQLIHQESLFFVLPFFFVTTTWNSGQAVFTGALAIAGLISITDPIYYKWLAGRRWTFLGYHTLTLFAVLLTALPIILQLSTPESYKWALGIAVALSFPSLVVSVGIHKWWRWVALLGLTLCIGAAGWFGRAWVPPSTLWMTEMALTEQFDNSQRTPGDSLEQVSVAQIRSQGLYAYTAISAPRGLDERIYHVWRQNGKEVDRIALDIHGGREAGYRAWTHKQNFPGDPSGRWQVQVVTEVGQVIGTLRFEVTP
ncbi:DUF5924 family protein [Pseudomonas knackmussii]|uniref:DUF5924 family protein n=1 Tax=Pseudomonas knackmussii TaxID=65741 RepID=UPI00191C12AE|nr:DUF5924 family protein [Pseudomonas knackmussii]